MKPPAPAEVATARRLILFVGALYVTAQLVAFSLERAPGWDEAIYLSQVSPEAEPLPFVPSRARGITFLVAPVLLLGGSLEQLRVVLAVVSGLALIGAAWIWVPVIGFGAPAAALIAGGSWPALFYGTEVMPNLFAAFAGAAATGILARRLSVGRRRTDELVTPLLLAAMAVVRPLDAAVLTAVLVLIPLVTRGRSLAWSVLLPLGLAVGWAPWIVEMSSRFGGVREAFAAAADVGHTGRWSAQNAVQYLALSDGPTAGPVPDPSVPRSGLFWLVGLAMLVIVGVFVARRRSLLPAVLVPILAGLVLAAVYVLFISIPAPRFLLPSLVVLSFPAGLGLAQLLRGLRPPIRVSERRIAVGIVAVVLTGTWLVSQLTVATDVEEDLIAQRRSAERAGERLRSLVAGEPCRVFSSNSFPMIGYAAGCEAVPIGLITDDVLVRRANHLIRQGIRPFLVRLEEEPPAPPRGVSEPVRVDAIGRRSWFLFAWTT
jgi:hypothetical protein